MTGKQKEQREEALARSCGVCAVCGKPLVFAAGQYAHRIGNTKLNRDLYGSFFIDSTFNGEYTCSLECNKKVDVGRTPGAILSTLSDILVKEIKKFEGKQC